MIERHWNADLLAKLIGLVFLAVGILGFIPNPLVAEGGVFEVNVAHNLVHLATGAIFLAGASLGAPVVTIRAMAILYTLVAVLGFVLPGEPLFGLVALNLADRWLHLALALGLLLIGFLAPMRAAYRAAHM